MGGNCITKSDDAEGIHGVDRAFRSRMDQESAVDSPEVLHERHGPKRYKAARLQQAPMWALEIIERNLNKHGEFSHSPGKSACPGAFLDPYELSDGSVYIGHWWLGKRHGNGLIVETDGTMTEGPFVNDNHEGRCRVIYPNGDVYTGHLINEMPAHQGCYVKADGTYYDGDWLNGQQEGFGKEVWPNGEIYKGDFRAGMKEGSGELMNESFSYKGEFKANRIEGRGRLCFTQAKSPGTPDFIILGLS